MDWKKELLEYFQKLNNRKDLGIINGLNAAPKDYVENYIRYNCPNDIQDKVLKDISIFLKKNMYGYQYEIENVISLIENRY